MDVGWTLFCFAVAALACLVWHHLTIIGQICEIQRETLQDDTNRDPVATARFIRDRYKVVRSDYDSADAAWREACRDKTELQKQCDETQKELHKITADNDRFRLENAAHVGFIKRMQDQFQEWDRDYNVRLRGVERQQQPRSLKELRNRVLREHHTVPDTDEIGLDGA